MTHDILILGGAGLPAWIWGPTLAALPSELRATVAPRPTASDTTLDDLVDAALDAAPSDRFTVVAHSAGGVVAAGLAARAPQRLDGLLAVSAVVPAPGRSFLGTLPFPQRLVVDLVLRAAGTRPPESAIRAGVGAGLPESVIDRLVADFAPESPALFRARVPGSLLPAHRRALLTTADRELPIALQRTIADRLGGSRRELPTGHLPMLEAPDLLAEEIVAFLGVGATA